MAVDKDLVRTALEIMANPTYGVCYEVAEAYLKLLKETERLTARVKELEVDTLLDTLKDALNGD